MPNAPKTTRSSPRLSITNHNGRIMHARHILCSSGSSKSPREVKNAISRLRWSRLSGRETRSRSPKLCIELVDAAQNPQRVFGLPRAGVRPSRCKGLLKRRKRELYNFRHGIRITNSTRTLITWLAPLAVSSHLLDLDPENCDTDPITNRHIHSSFPSRSIFGEFYFFRNK